MGCNEQNDPRWPWEFTQASLDGKPTGSRNPLSAGIRGCIWMRLLFPWQENSTFPWASESLGAGQLALPDNSSNSWCLNADEMLVSLFTRISLRFIKENQEVQRGPSTGHRPTHCLGYPAPACLPWDDEWIKNTFICLLIFIFCLKDYSLACAVPYRAICPLPLWRSILCINL